MPLNRRAIVMASLIGVCAAVLLLLGEGPRILPDRFKDLDTHFERLEDQVLIRAVLDGDNRKVLRALKSGADVNAIGEGGWTPLMLAYSLKDKKMFALLLDLKADATAVNPPMSKSVMYAVATYPNISFLKALIDRGFDVNSRSMADETPIYASISGNLHHHFRLLLDAGADLEVVNAMGATPLMHCLAMGRFDMAIELISRGARADVHDQGGHTLFEVLQRSKIPTPPGQEPHREVLLRMLKNANEESN